MSSGPIFDAGDADFEARVVQRSREVPVVVDFWAAWCAPCRQLTPALEKATRARDGKIELAKVDVDANTALASRFRVQGIPAVKAFRDGEVASEFTGALPPAAVERFFDSLVPSEADRLAAAGVEQGDEAALRRALDLDPANTDAKRGLGRMLLQQGRLDEALSLLEPAGGDFLADGLAARARLLLDRADGLEPAFEAWDSGDHSAALEGLQRALGEAPDTDRRDLIRRAMVGIFTELGQGHPLAQEHRRRLAAALN